MTVALSEGRSVAPFHHEAVLYDGIDGFMDWAVPFIREGVLAGEAVLVVVDELKIQRLRQQLGQDAVGVDFRDMNTVGVNPANIISAWATFVDDRSGSAPGLRGIGEPVWPGRNEAELVECFRHEQLLNVAFADSVPWLLVCPYDTSTLAPEVIEMAHRSHPLVRRGSVIEVSDKYDGLETCRSHAGELPDPPPDALDIRFSSAELIGTLRLVCEREAARSGIAVDRLFNVAMAATEVMTNSINHGGGRARLRLWGDEVGFWCDVEDGGTIVEPLVGRIPPSPFRVGGRGLFLANQFCDLVQVRSNPGRTVVRLLLKRP